MSSWGCGAHLGDVFWTLSYLLKSQGHHTLYVLPEFVEPITPFAWGSNVTIKQAGELPPNAEDTWIANGRHEEKQVIFMNQEDIIGFVFDYFNSFGKAWNQRKDMLMDLPWIKPVKFRDTVLILNTQPMSGQCPGYSQDEVNQLTRDLIMDGQRVVSVCNDDGSHKFSLAQIACIAAESKLIIGGASGPFFATMHTAASLAHRIVLLDPMFINYGETVGPIYSAKHAEHARVILRECNYFRYK